MTVLLSLFNSFALLCWRRVEMSAQFAFLIGLTLSFLSIQWKQRYTLGSSWCQWLINHFLMETKKIFFSELGNCKISVLIMRHYNTTVSLSMNFIQWKNILNDRHVKCTESFANSSFYKLTEKYAYNSTFWGFDQFSWWET